jgi:hypothetical protein
MANVILRHFPLQGLVKISRNPFQFILLYNLAARRDGEAPVFLPEAIKLVKGLEKKYKK